MITQDQLRSGFLARSRREKFLTVVFVVVLALIWASTLLTRAKAFSLRLSMTNATANSQAQWLDNAELIDTRYNEAIGRLSGATLPSGNQVLQEVDALVRKYGFASYAFDAPQRQSRDRLTFHTIGLSLQKAEWGKLQAFQNELSAVLPTVNLAQIVLNVPDRRNPALLDARLRLVAVEFNQ